MKVEKAERKLREAKFFLDKMRDQECRPFGRWNRRATTRRARSRSTSSPAEFVRPENRKNRAFLYDYRRRPSE